MSVNGWRTGYRLIKGSQSVKTGMSANHYCTYQQYNKTVVRKNIIQDTVNISASGVKNYLTFWVFFFFTRTLTL